MLKIVKTENGLIKGLQGNNARITAFKGIPFAAPPVGKNRWRAPQPAENWEGIREAYAFGPIPMQDTPGLGTDIYCREWHVDPDLPMSEDCLYLNVWTPATTTEDKLPVLVWFFGGAFQWGYTAEMEFNGENLAKRGIVVVTVSYRLGALGFMVHPEITKEAPEAHANFGNLDQLAGLKWVNRNIAAFGGDPSNITIAGQSAGGGSVLSHLTSRLSEGYFQKAFIMSGIVRTPYYPDLFITPDRIENKYKNGEDFISFLGVSSVEEARKLDALYIRDKYSEFMRNSKNRWFAPVIDDHFMTEEPYKLFATGNYRQVPIIVGNTKDEFPSTIPADNEDNLKEKAVELFGDRAEEFLSFKEAHVNNNNCYAPVRGLELSTKCGFKANKENSFFYLFEPDIPGEDNPGTFHSVDLWFFFDTIGACNRPYTGRHFDLARKMANYLTNFIKSGNPNGQDIDGTEMPLWKPYTESSKDEMHFTADGPAPKVYNDHFGEFLIERIRERCYGKKVQAFNPYLPSWEYIPDGEPYVFGNRVYVYGSHDAFRGHAFCLNDYVCWSADINDLGNWRYEGVIYTRLDDPLNVKDNKMCLYAPDVVQGADGRYYLYYVLDKISVVSVAVCDTPAGRYEFYGYVHYSDGTKLGDKEGDEPQFDPGVIMVDNKVYLYTGFCGIGDKSRSGAMMTVLDKDMLTILEAPKIMIPGSCYSENTEYKGHAFFEAPSIRYFDGRYYLIYSSEVMHELCYGISDNPKGPFSYGGVIVSNTDLHIDSYKEAEEPAAYGANNHGSLIEINGTRYIFYHRHTMNTWYSRQGCAEPVTFNPDGSIVQAEITSCGLNGGPLNDTDEYPAYIACNLIGKDKTPYLGGHQFAHVTQEGKDGDEYTGYIEDIHDGTIIGFKYFDCKNVKGIRLTSRGYAGGKFKISTGLHGPYLAEEVTPFCTVWETFDIDVKIPDGKTSLYITYEGGGCAELKSFKFLH